MPNTASAKKRLRQSVVLRERNRATKTTLRSLTKKIREAVIAKDVETSTASYSLLVKKLDRAASRNVIHANAAARTKSRLSKAIKAIKGK
jgi:small subunit ribosomal protein S20